jgi:very-short-patch-repair endonuclease
MPVGPFFADFLCRDAKLVIELDGASHDHRLAEDETRDAYLRSRGYVVLRFQNADLIGNLEGVLSAISDALRAAHP